MDIAAPRLYPNGIRPYGSAALGVGFDVKCACGITATVATVKWGLQCMPCHEAAAAKEASL